MLKLYIRSLAWIQRLANTRADLRGLNFARRAFRFRVFGPLTLGAATLPTLSEQNAQWPTIASVLFFCVGWPLMARALSVMAKNRAIQERNNQLVDAWFAGYVIAAFQFVPVPSAMLVLITCMNSVAVGGLGSLLLGVIATALGIVIGVVFLGFNTVGMGGPFSLLASILGFMAYPLILGCSSHRVAVELADRSRRLKEISVVDELTGLPNRRGLIEATSHLFEQDSEGCLKYAVLLVNIDDFKTLNNLFGHLVGDEVLTTVGNRLLSLKQKPVLIGRCGGDEFVLVTHHQSETQLSALINVILLELGRPLCSGDHDLRLQANVGYSCYPSDSTDPHTLIRLADVAVYAAKNAGGNRFERYDPCMTTSIAEKVELTRRLRNALEQNQLTLHYQPQVDMRGRRVVGVEALVRWTDPELGPIAPDRFIPIAEASGLIVRLGEWVLFEACRQAMEWRECGLQSVQISVNLSPVQLQRVDVVSLVRRALHETGLPAAILELEITEGALMVDPVHSANVLNKLRADGIRVAIDDFGTGYSSLNYFQQFRFDRIKIDRAFVAGLGTGGPAEAIAIALIALCKALNVGVIAEGLETEAHRTFLTQQGCVYGQGFYYSRAVAPSVIAEMLAEPSIVVLDALVS